MRCTWASGKKRQTPTLPLPVLEQRFCDEQGNLHQRGPEKISVTLAANTFNLVCCILLSPASGSLALVWFVCIWHTTLSFRVKPISLRYWLHNPDRKTKDKQLILVQVSAIRHNNGIFYSGKCLARLMAIPRGVRPRGIPVMLNSQQVRLSVSFET